MIQPERGVQLWPVELKSGVIPAFDISDWANFEPDPRLSQRALDTSFHIPNNARKQLDDSMRGTIQQRGNLPPRKYKSIDPFRYTIGRYT